MKHFCILLVTVLLFVGCQKKENLETTTINASSMVCGTCARTIEKAVAKVDGVQKVNVDVNNKIVEVKFVPSRTNVETIETAITESGYDANNRKRNPDAYEKLDGCCKIDG